MARNGAVAKKSKQEEAEALNDAKGKIGRRSILFDTYSGGLYMVAIANIGTLQIETDTAAHKQRRKIGWFLIIAGVPALIFLGAGLLLMYFGYRMIREKATTHLAIGTSDNRTYLLASKDRKFLEDMLRFLAQKIEDDNQANITAQFDAKNATFHVNAAGGAVAIGDNAQSYMNTDSAKMRQPANAS